MDEFFREDGEFPELPKELWIEPYAKNHKWMLKEGFYECERCKRIIKLDLIVATDEMEDCNNLMTDDILES